MPILTKAILDNIGIQLSDSDYASLAEHFETTLTTQPSCSGYRQMYKISARLSVTR